MRLVARLTIAALLLCGLTQASGAELKLETTRAFQRYVHAAEQRMERDRSRPGHFLYIDSFSPSKRRAIRADLRNGDVYVDRLTTRDDRGDPIRAPDGWIHHWIGAVFVPHATLQQVVAINQDYDKYSTFYKPEMVRSHILEHHDNSFKVYARLQKITPWVTVTLDTYSDVHYVYVDSQHLYSVAHAYLIQQVDNAGTPEEHVDPPGHGAGFLWALEVFWRYEVVPGGIMVESETMALTRTLPFGLGWILKPFIHRATMTTEKELMSRTRQIIERWGEDHAPASAQTSRSEPSSPAADNSL